MWVTLSQCDIGLICLWTKQSSVNITCHFSRENTERPLLLYLMIAFQAISHISSQKVGNFYWLVEKLREQDSSDWKASQKNLALLIETFSCRAL